MCLPQQGLGSSGIADGRGAAAQSGQRVSLVPYTACSAGQFHGLLMTRLSRGGGVHVANGDAGSQTGSQQ